MVLDDCRGRIRLRRTPRLPVWDGLDGIEFRSGLRTRFYTALTGLDWVLFFLIHRLSACVDKCRPFRPYLATDNRSNILNF